MRTMNSIFAALLLLVVAGSAQVQTNKSAQVDVAMPEDHLSFAVSAPLRVAQNAAVTPQERADKSTPTLDAQREKAALKIFLREVQTPIVGAAEAMPADQYGFAPTEGEFKGVRTFGQQVKHLAATNNILAAAALGQDPPSDAGDEAGPETVRTKAELLNYLNESFAHLGKAIDAIGVPNATVKASPISPLREGKATRLALTVESLIHAFDHYGQMVVYLRMVGVVPPASR